MKAYHIILALQLFVVTFVFATPLIDGPKGFYLDQIDTAKIFGISVVVIGGLLGLWAVRTMSKNFVVSAKPKETSLLVMKGPFNLVRNPIYLSLHMMTFGWCLVFSTIVGTLASVSLIFILQKKISFEEKFLSEKFGTAYTNYTQAVPRLIPKIFKS